MNIFHFLNHKWVKKAIGAGTRSGFCDGGKYSYKVAFMGQYCPVCGKLRLYTLTNNGCKEYIDPDYYFAITCKGKENKASVIKQIME